MSYFTGSFLSHRREEWLKAIAYVEILANSSWYRGTITKKEISSDSVIVTATFPQLDEYAAAITASRIIDIRGEVAAYQSKSLSKIAGQGTLLKIQIPIREV